MAASLGLFGNNTGAPTARTVSSKRYVGGGTANTSFEGRGRSGPAPGYPYQENGRWVTPPGVVDYPTYSTTGRPFTPQTLAQQNPVAPSGPNPYAYRPSNPAQGLNVWERQQPGSVSRWWTDLFGVTSPDREVWQQAAPQVDPRIRPIKTGRPYGLNPLTTGNPAFNTPDSVTIPPGADGGPLPDIFRPYGELERARASLKGIPSGVDMRRQVLDARTVTRSNQRLGALRGLANQLRGRGQTRLLAQVLEAISKTKRRSTAKSQPTPTIPTRRRIQRNLTPTQKAEASVRAILRAS